MENLIEERYVFWRMASQDFFEAAETLEFISESENTDIQLALFKSAVVSFCRPFSGNKAVHKEQGWIIDPNWVSDKKTFDLAKKYRDRLFAHSDLTVRNPKLGKIGNRFPIVMKGFYFDQLMDLVIPLLAESKYMYNQTLEKIKEYESKHF